jgi:hypothetical protein
MRRLDGAQRQQRISETQKPKQKQKQKQTADNCQ